MVEKVRARVTLEWSDGNDGRDGHYFVKYWCSQCNKSIKEDDIACDVCGTFFDWSKKAKIVVHRDIEWR